MAFWFGSLFSWGIFLVGFGICFFGVFTSGFGGHFVLIWSWHLSFQGPEVCDEALLSWIAKHLPAEGKQ